MKKSLRTSLLVGLLTLVGVSQVWAGLTATEVTSSYTPTQIVNGNFDVEPWMTYTYQGTTYTSCPHININQSANDAPVSNVVFNGVNGGWNTTDLNVWESNLFEYTFRTSGTHSHQHNGSIPQSDKYIEMNCLHSCMLYQDLTTKGGDIIRWTLDHAVTQPCCGINPVQPMRVEIGAPNRDGSGNVVNASGWADNLNTQMVTNTVAQYRYDGITNPSGKTYGYGNTSELQYLRLTRANNDNGWWNCKGVYIVPEGQTVTRFGFISEAASPEVGNLLDNVTFSTLLGNLKAVANANGSATITGYWGDSDNTKRLMIKIGDEDAIPADMSSVINKNFSIDVPAATIGDATSITVYHQDYPDASKTVAIFQTKATEVTSSYTPTQIVNGNFDVEPWMTYTYQGTTYTSCPHINIDQSANDAPVSNVVFNGVNGGWNTTELNVWNSNLFEYTFRTSGTHSIRHNSSIPQSDKYIEMNCLHSCMLYQDLTTKGGDIIRWTLDHAVTQPCCGINPVQPMRVEIGAPNRDGSGNIVNASGWANNLNTQMVTNTVAQYRYDGITNPSGKTYGYGNTSELQYLRLTRANNDNGWWNCKGVYVVPEGQTVTRFGFISEAETPDVGNLLDNITFSTLLGNLKAVTNADGSATITGYWGDSDNTKRLMIKIGDEDAIPTDMSSVINKNFSIDVPAATIGDATSFTVYHQDYPDASKTVAILKTITDGTGMSFSDAESFINDKLTSWQGACAGSKTISLIIERNIYKDGYFNTLCLPFDATADQIAATFGEAPKELKKYLSCTVQGEGDDREIIIDTKDTTGIKAGEAYLISFENGTTLTSLTFQNVQVTITEPIAQTGDLYYQGVLAPVVMEYDNQNLLFVGEQNRLYWPKNDGTFLKGFRAYFKVTGGTVQGAPVRNGMKASFGTGKTVATGVNNLSTNNEVRKLIQQGRVVIRTNGVMYDMNGNIVK